MRRKADLLIPPELDVFEAVKAANAASGPLACVLCDESQFFTPEQAEQLFMITVDLNIPVICYGLRQIFPSRLPGFYPSAGAGAHHRGDEDHLHLRPQGHLQLPQSQRPLRL